MAATCCCWCHSTLTQHLWRRWLLLLLLRSAALWPHTHSRWWGSAGTPPEMAAGGSRQAGRHMGAHSGRRRLGQDDLCEWWPSSATRQRGRLSTNHWTDRPRINRLPHEARPAHPHLPPPPAAAAATAVRPCPRLARLTCESASIGPCTWMPPVLSPAGTAAAGPDPASLLSM